MLNDKKKKSLSVSFKLKYLKKKWFNGSLMVSWIIRGSWLLYKKLNLEAFLLGKHSLRVPSGYVHINPDKSESASFSLRFDLFQAKIEQLINDLPSG